MNGETIIVLTAKALFISLAKNIEFIYDENLQPNIYVEREAGSFRIKEAYFDQGGDLILIEEKNADPT